jgi:hypothetical protein
MINDATRKLILNRILIGASVDTIDYEITHELCHVRQLTGAMRSRWRRPSRHRLEAASAQARRGNDNPYILNISV